MAQASDKPVKPPTVGPTTLGSEYAPFIYFDGVVTLGVNSGAIQIDLAANIIVPDADAPNGVRTDVVTTAHQETAARRAVMAGAEGQRGFDLDANAVRRHSIAIVRAVNEKATGRDRFQSGKTFAHPVFRRDRLETKRLAGVRACGDSRELAQRRFIGSVAKKYRHAPIGQSCIRPRSRLRALPTLCLRRIHKAHGDFIGRKALGEEIGHPARRLFIAFEHGQLSFVGNGSCQIHCNPGLCQRFTRNSQSHVPTSASGSGVTLFGRVSV